jgi:alkylation response protein AidB-like acyl-CoA dehydrogenase
MLDAVPARPVGARAARGPWLARVLEEARLALADEAYGAIRALNALTLAYLKERRQFRSTDRRQPSAAAPDGGAALLQEELRAVLSAAQRAVRACPADGPLAPGAKRAVAAAAAHAAQAARQVAHEGVQMHGGIGMTHELSVSHYFKRLMVVARLLGDRESHLARFAAASATA